MRSDDLLNAPLLPHIPGPLLKHDLLVLAWNEHYLGEEFLSPVELPCGDGINLVMHFTTDRRRLAEADAVWFHGPTLIDLPRKRTAQPWILMSMESDVNCPALASPRVGQMFEITMSYRLDSDVPCVYASWREYDSFTVPGAAKRTATRPAVYIASNPVKYRDQYVAALMEHMPVDCPGSCLANCTVEGVSGSLNRRLRDAGTLRNLIRNYWFNITFENSISKDYVTEKVYNALACGTVPVYCGAPNIREFLPHEDAAILADDFPSPSALAEYLLDLVADPHAYEKHLAWKHSGITGRFRNLLDLGNVDSRFRLAVKLAHGCDRDCRCGGRMRSRRDA